MNLRLLLAGGTLALGLAACNASAPAPASIPAAPALMHHTSTLAPGTLFVAVGDGSLPGSVVISAPPYTSRGGTRPSLSPLAVAVTADDSLIVAGAIADAPLTIVPEPYAGAPKTIAHTTWGGGIALDKRGNLFIAEAGKSGGRSSYLELFRGPSYKTSLRFGSSPDRLISSVVAMPDGGLAIGSSNGLDIYRAPYASSTKIAKLSYVQAIAIVPAGLVVMVCPTCYRASGSSYLALVAPPYASVHKILAKLPAFAATSIASNPAGDVFIDEGGTLYRFAPPYAVGKELAKAGRVLEAMGTAPNGDLFFGSTSQPGVGGQFAIVRLPAPYTGDPQTLFNTPGVPGGMTVTQ